MQRETRATGVGRGNGTGSRRTQFSDGAPSGNPNGRPRKRHLPPATNILEALQRLLEEEIEVRIGQKDNGEPVVRKMPRLDALAESMMSKLGNASLREQTMFIRQMGGFDALARKPYVIPEDVAQSIMAQLAAEAELDIARGLYPDPRLQDRSDEPVLDPKSNW